MPNDAYYGGREEIYSAKELEKLKQDKEAEIARLKKLELFHCQSLRDYLRSIDNTNPYVTPLLASTPILQLPEILEHTPAHRIPLTGVAQTDIVKVKKLRREYEELERKLLPKLKKLHTSHHDDHYEEAPKYLDRDKRYQDLLKANPLVVRLRQEQPTLTISSIAELEPGVFGLNPDLTEHLLLLDKQYDAFEYEEKARKEFAEKYAQEAKAYEEAEKHRTYQDPEKHDPAVIRMTRQIEKEVSEQTAALAAGAAVIQPTPPPPPAKTPEQIRSEVEKKNYLAFARKYPQKAAFYAQTLSKTKPGLLPAWVQVKAELEQAEAEKNGPTPTQRRQILQTYLQDKLRRTPIPSPAPQAQAPLQPIQGLRRAMPISSYSSNRRPAFVPGAPVEQTPLRSQRRPQRRALPALPNISSISNLANLASRAGALAGFFSSPPGWITIGVILLLLLLFLFTNTPPGAQNPDGTYPVNITKTGPTAVPNPESQDPKKTDVSDITYKINVTYGGSADTIVVTDPLDQNATFISADGPGNPTYDNKNHTVTWNITPGSEASAPSASPTKETSLLPFTFVQQVHAQSTESGYKSESFSKEGLPAPQTPNPVTLDPEALKLWKENFMSPAMKAADKVGIDVGWVGFWSFYEGINFNTTFNNCNEAGDRFNPNNPCASNSWQVGPAVRPFDLPVSAMQEAFDAMYGDHNPETVQRVGQQVIERMQERHNTKLTYPATTFPKVTLEEVSRMDSPEMRQWFVHLTRDDAIGMYYIAKTFKGHVDAPETMAARMCGWGACGAGEHYDPQRTSNYIKAVYDAGLTDNESSPAGFGTISLALTVRPKTANSWVVNKAYAEVVGARSPLPGSKPGNGRPGQPLPSNDVNQIKEIMCDQYKVCPTEVQFAEQAPNSGWTLDQLTALWNVVQRIYESETYKTLAIGNYPLEITRAKCYPIGCDGTYGYYAGQGYPEWHKDPTSRLVVITDLFANSESNPTRMEWLFAHEIGHSASGGDFQGGLTSELGMNEPYKKVQACDEQVSTYGGTNWNENNSEILSFYMTAGEEANSGYLGSNKNLKTDFPCTYNAVKQYFFDNVEF